MPTSLRSFFRRVGLSLITDARMLSAPARSRVRRLLYGAQLADALRRLQINCVIDVGANKGQFALLLREIGYHGLILSFEPNPSDYRNLCGALVNDDAWEGFNMALGATAGVSGLNVAEISEFSSFLSLGRSGVELHEVVDVPVWRLDSMSGLITERVNAPRIFLKTDTQGYDLEVVRGAEGLLPHVLLLQSEVSIQRLYDGAPSYTDALIFYESLGFKVVDFFEVKRNEQEDTIMEYDCLMIRSRSDHL